MNADQKADYLLNYYIQQYLIDQITFSQKRWKYLLVPTEVFNIIERGIKFEMFEQIPKGYPFLDKEMEIASFKLTHLTVYDYEISLVKANIEMPLATDDEELVRSLKVDKVEKDNEQ